jgi:hypothetical protein
MDPLVAEHLGERRDEIQMKPAGDGDLRRVDADRAELAGVIDLDDARDRQRLARGQTVASLARHCTQDMLWLVK